MFKIVIIERNMTEQIISYIWITYYIKIDYAGFYLYLFKKLKHQNRWIIWINIVLNISHINKFRGNLLDRTS